jgi:hypothetical protein
MVIQTTCCESQESNSRVLAAEWGGFAAARVLAGEWGSFAAEESSGGGGGCGGPGSAASTGASHKRPVEEVAVE